jgi:glycolate oxidase
MTDSFFERTFGQTLDVLNGLTHDQRAGVVRAKISDLNFFFDEGAALDQRDAPPRTRAMATSLCAALLADAKPEPAEAVRERIVTNQQLRTEADRDQNVYFGPLFTRTMTRAVPDLIFQPVSLAECAVALAWGRDQNVPVTLRGAASTAMGGAVPNDGGLTLDLSRIDSIDVEPAAGVCVVGAGARLRVIHQKLAERGFALKVYPSNLGGTLTGWFVTGGIGMNAFLHGRALDQVRAADVLLPAGEHVRFHDDGRLDVPGERGHRHTLAATEAAAWFATRGYPLMTLADLAGSEGTLGLLVHLTVRIEKRPEIGAFLLSFASATDALAAARWAGRAGAPKPANVKFLSGSHLHHTQRVWREEDARGWRAHPSAISSDARLPWTRIAGPAALGARPAIGARANDSKGGAHDTHEGDAGQGAWLFVDFLNLDDARAFARELPDCPGHPSVHEQESVRFAAERFRPQQSKRFGPGLLAAEIVMPASEVAPFLPRAERLARNAGNALDTEVYFLADGTALTLAGYLLDHRRGSFAVDLMIAPALLDLAMSRHHGRPYVLGRWQSPYLARKFGADGARRFATMKHALDPRALLNRGVMLGLKLHGTIGALFTASYAPGIALARMVLATPGLGAVARLVRALLSPLPGPAHGRGEPAREPATHAARPAPANAPQAETPQAASARALHCVNCGECNTVCPIFNESKIRLPQMLTHAGEGMHAGEAPSATTTALLDLCMRCGNCEEVCQAGIPHLPLYQAMQGASNQARPYRRDRHEAILTTLRASNRYLRDFLDVRPGGYQRRAPASLAGMDRYLLLRAENEDGPAASCIHCGACVAVCPTSANQVFEGEDPRSITTDQHRCIGCGTCVEICPANQLNGGQTLRVMEAPTREWFMAIEDFISQEIS